jgi:hypothetical protein
MTSPSPSDPAKPETMAESVDSNDEYADAEKNYKPRSLKFWTILIGMYLAMFLVALVGTSFVTLRRVCG